LRPKALAVRRPTVIFRPAADGPHSGPYGWRRARSGPAKDCQAAWSIAVDGSGHAPGLTASAQRAHNTGGLQGPGPREVSGDGRCLPAGGRQDSRTGEQPWDGAGDRWGRGSTLGGRAVGPGIRRLRTAAAVGPCRGLGEVQGLARQAARLHKSRHIGAGVPSLLRIVSRIGLSCRGTNAPESILSHPVYIDPRSPDTSTRPHGDFRLRMNEKPQPPYLKHAIADGLATFSGEGKNERIHYVAANHSERWADPEEKVRAEFWAGPWSGFLRVGPRRTAAKNCMISKAIMRLDDAPESGPSMIR
jgi:hypothetical protein